MKQTILITGGNGYIGSNLIKTLSNNHNIINFSKSLNKNPKITSFQGDITKAEDLKPLENQNINGIIHLAAVSRVGDGEKDPLACLKTNLIGTLNILEFARKQNTWVIFGGTGESTSNIYGLSKHMADKLCKYYSNKYNLRIISLEFASVYGSYDRPNKLIPTLIRKALANADIILTNTKKSFDFIYIDDLIEGICSALELIKTQESYSKFQICSGESLNLKELTQLIINKTKSKSRVIIESKIEEENPKFNKTPYLNSLNFKPKTNLKKGIEKTIEKYKMKRLSDAAYQLEGQKMFQILAKAKELERQGREIIHFEIGDPDFNTPENIKNSVSQALENNDTHYAVSSGLRDLKIAAADVTEKRSRGFRPDLNQILVTPGANVQIYYAIACSVNPGEEIIIPDPSFVSYKSIINFLGMKPIGIPLKEENNFRLNPDDVEKAITDKTRMIIINSPHNPTGAVMTEGEIKKIYDLAEKHDLYLLSDEIYARMIYKDSETSFSTPSKYDQCKERVILVNGFSKSYAMTGWRLGVMIAPSDLVEKMGLLLETTTSCVSPFLQRAGIEALKGDQQPINQMVEEFRKRRDLIVEGLNSLPKITCLKPGGAFYVFANIKETGMKSQEFSDLLLEKAGVATCPGNFFGKYGEGYVRFCYANSIENIKKGIEKIRSVLESVTTHLI